MNLGHAVSWLESKLETWVRLPLSLAGRIAIAKMIVLPKFLYLFVNLPLILTKAFLHKLRSLMINLVWAGRQAHISWELLTLHLTRGGLGAPDISLYAYCAQAQFLHHWVFPTPFQPHIAIELEVRASTTKCCNFFQIQRPRNEIDTTETLRWAWNELRARAG